MTFRFHTTVRHDWIDHNGHMRDAYYGLVFSLASDAFLESIGVDAPYRAQTGATVYLAECHTHYLAEVKEGAALEVEARVLGAEPKRFLVHMTMLSEGRARAVNERMELHIQQSPKPHVAPMPAEMLERLQTLKLDDAATRALPKRARALGFG